MLQRLSRKSIHFSWLPSLGNSSQVASSNDELSQWTRTSVVGFLLSWTVLFAASLLWEQVKGGLNYPLVVEWELETWKTGCMPDSRDINECLSLSPCKKICQNFLGGFKCACPKGFEGDGMKNGTGCTVSQSRTKTIRLALLVDTKASLKKTTLEAKMQMQHRLKRRERASET
uniref:EGF-like domain-containing protein n=1 Tax=Quercus lobata TaxID=97700 RepID=A0A7N2RBP8_QUELO